MKKAIIIAALTVILSCQQKKAPTDLRVVLDWTPNTNHTGLYVALEKGYFAEEGLTVTMLQPPEDGALALVASGGAEFGIDFQETMGPAVAKELNALPVVAVAGIINHNTSGIMSLSSSGIHRPADLAGRRFASWETPFYTAIIRSLVNEDGGNFDEVRMIPNNATDAFSALETDIDAIWIYYAWDGIAAEVRGTAINYLDIGAINPIFDFYTPVIVANSTYVTEHEEIVKKFLSAASRGYRDAMNDPDSAAEILITHAPELDSDLVHRSQRYLADRYQGDAPRWGEIDRERWGRFYGWMYENGLLERDIRYEGFRNDFLP
ncbi:ABC transporter substrate-binding protein [Pillotina sp. SPG140]|jgi:ABC-type nitrate/sulfonate/bicarbonate transport system substrate-binding protein